MTDLELAAEIVEAMRIISARFWVEWGARFDGLNDDRKEILQQELQVLIEAERLRLLGLAADDHLVIGDTSDPTPGTAEEKVIGDGTTASTTTVDHQVVISAKGDHKVDVNAAAHTANAEKYLADAINPTLPLRAVANDPAHELDVTIDSATALADGVAKIGSAPGLPPVDGGSCGDLTVAKFSQEEHRHGPAAPESHGSKLYTARVPDPLLHAAVDAVYTGPLIQSVRDLWSSWAQTSTGHWVANSNGGMIADWFDDVTPFDGMRVLAWNTGTDSAGNDKRYAVVYILTSKGSGISKAHLDVATDFDEAPEVVNGSHVYVTAGAVYGELDLQVTAFESDLILWSTPLSWTTLAVLPSATDELLDAAHLGSADPGVYTKMLASDRSTELVCTYHGDLLAGLTLPEDGIVRFGVQFQYVGDAPAEGLVLECELLVDTTVVASASSAAIAGNSSGALEVVAAVTAATPIPIGTHVHMRVHSFSAAVAPVNVTVIYNKPVASWVELPLDFGQFGTLDHQQLTVASRGFVAGQEADAVTYTHTTESLRPGLTQVRAATGAVTSYVLPVPTEQLMVVDATGPIYGMGIPTFATDCTATIRLAFVQATIIADHVGAGPCDENLQFRLRPAADVDDRTFPAGGTADFIYRSDGVDGAGWYLVVDTVPVVIPTPPLQGILRITRYTPASTATPQTLVTQTGTVWTWARGRGGSGGGGAACSQAEGSYCCGAAGSGGAQGGLIDIVLAYGGGVSITAITVGAGGAGGTSSSTTALNGTDGAATTFTTNEVFSAVGGQGGVASKPAGLYASGVLVVTTGGLASSTGTNAKTNGSPGHPSFHTHAGAQLSGSGGGDGGGGGRGINAGAGRDGTDGGGGGAMVLTGVSAGNYPGGKGADGWLEFIEFSGDM